MMRSEVAHRGDFGVGDDHGLVGIAHRQRGTALDARRTVAEHPVEPGSEVLDDALDAFIGQRVLVPGLRSRKQPQILEPLVADQRLRKFRHALHDVDEVEYDPPLRPHNEIEIPQADVEIDDDDLFSNLRQRRTERRGGGGLANPALA